MKKILVIYLSLLSMVASAQRRERRTLSTPATSSDFPVNRTTSRSERHSKVIAAQDAGAIQQAPGVVQINSSDTQRSAWFVITDRIPAGSQLTAYIDVTTPSNDSNGLPKLGPITYNQDLQPGTSLLLPRISEFGDFWPTGVTTYDVVVKTAGTVTHNAADFTIGSARNYSDLNGSPLITPLIYSWSENILNRQVILTVKGNFSSDPVKVVLTDLVVPRSAITLSADGSTISINLTQVAGARLDILQDFLLTVGQAGYSDTRTFTHVPFDPSSYNPSPSLP